MLPPQLKHGAVLGHGRLITSCARVAVPAGQRPLGITLNTDHQRRSFWKHRNQCWDSHLDQEYHDFQRKRHRRARAALRDAVRRRSQWQTPSLFGRLFGLRHASHWSKDFGRWNQLGEDITGKKTEEGDKYELSPREKQWKEKTEAMRKEINADPYRAVFGKPFDPFWSPAAWSSIIPSWVKVEDPHTDKAPQKKSKIDVEPESVKAKSPSRYVESTSYTYSSQRQPGKSPMISATSSSWDSASNVTRTYKYDPVTGRMILSNAQSEDKVVKQPQTLGSASSEDHSTSAKTATSPPEPSKLVSQAQQQVSKESRKSSTNTSPSLESKPVSSLASTKAKLTGLPKDDLDFVTADSIRASMKTSSRNGKASDQATAKATSDLNTNFETRNAKLEQELADARRSLGAALQKQKETESTLAFEGGINTRFSSKTQELEMELCKARSDLRTALQKQRAAQPNPQIGPAKRRQDAIEKESALRESIEHAQNPIQPALDRMNQMRSTTNKDEATQQRIRDALALLDGHSTNPMGMQTSYVNEVEACKSKQRPTLDSEIASMQKEADIDDGYTKEPIGLQTSFQSEKEAVSAKKQVPLAQEISQKASEGLTFNDGFTQDPVGLQKTYSTERNDVARAARMSLAQEIERNDKLAVEAHLGLGKQPTDGHSHKSTRLQDSYGKERMDSAVNTSKSLEAEMKAMNAPSKAFTDHQTHSPRGLQILYGQHAETIANAEAARNAKSIQRQDAAKAVLDSEVDSQKQAMRLYEARHAHGQAKKQQKPSVKSATSTPQVSAPIQAEGDICTNAANFANSDRWYKQTSVKPTPAYDLTATSKPVSQTNVNRLSDKELAQEVRKICEENGLLESASLEKMQNELVEKFSKLRRSVKTRVQNVEESLNNLKQKNKEAARSAQNSTGSVKWAEPPAYKIMTWDPYTWGDNVQIATTTSRYAEVETPMTVTQALSKIRKPGRFVTFFADFQTEGYQAIHAAEDMIVLRKAEVSNEQPSNTKTPTPTRPTTNPVDGTSRTPFDIPTGNFASPTGFVNHDPVFPLETAAAGPAHPSPLPPPTSSPEQDETYYRHYPRVKRQEAVFSGSERMRADEEERYHARYRRERKEAWRKRVRFALSVGVTSAVAVYALGVGAELARGGKGVGREV